VSEMLLELDRLSFIREGRYLLQDITWNVLPGENWVLFGRNGAGKTLLLELITGYIQSSGGTIRRFGKGYREGISIRELRKRIGYISTPLAALIPGHESLLHVIIGGVDASAGLWRRPTGEEIEKALGLLATIGMADRSEDPFRILSDGERQKVLMLRALINDPDILILDEPTKGLDLTSREEILSAMGRLFRRNRMASIIYVTHHTEEIVPLFHRIHILKEGRTLFMGNVEEGLGEHHLGEVFEKDVGIVNLNQRYYSVIK